MSGIAEELRQAEIDAACEFSQDRWERELVEGWKKDITLSGVIARCSGLEGITYEIWDRLFARARTMKPKLGEHTSGRNRVRVWIAQNATMANQSFYDGNFERAKKLLHRGGTAISGRRKNIKEVRKEEKKDKGTLFVGGRRTDKKHDWNTCK